MDRAVLETSSDRYVIVEYLAEGGMGAIYLGKKLGVGGFEKEVVLKQLLPEFTQEPKFIDLFLREARLSASLEHANIVHTIDLVNAGDDYFMVMEYVKGADLRTMLKRVRRKHKRFSPQAGVFIGHEILEALGYAHQKSAHDGRPLNLIHRDISPSNILLSGAGEVKLTDFGIAKASTHRSVFYKVKGKVGYMSPEQARGEPVDARSDLFSLGVVLYEVLVGERLFVGDIMSSASQIYAQPIKAPSNKRPEIPADLDAVILKSLSLDPSGRFQSAEEFQEALSRVATRHRLIIGASEMSGHLKQIAGEDAAMWLKLEMIGNERGEPTQAHGTAVLSSAEDDEGVGRPQFDVSDDDEEGDEDSDVDDLLRARNRPPSLPTGELTSVIAVRKKSGASDLLAKLKDPDATRDGTGREHSRESGREHSRESGREHSRETSRDRDGGREHSRESGREHSRESGREHSRETSRDRDGGRDHSRDGGRDPAPRWMPTGADEPPLPPLQAKRSEPIPAASTSAPRRVSTSKSASSSQKAEFGNEESRAQTKVRDPSPRMVLPPPRTPLSSPRNAGTAPGDETLVHQPSQAGFARPHAGDGSPQMQNPLGGSPLVASTHPSNAAAARRLPTSGIRQRPRGDTFNGTGYIRRPRRIIGIMIVLLLIGIGVALGVAFSGPELEVVDPSLAPAPTPPPASTAPAAGSPSPTVPAAPRQTPAPAELPGPPSAAPTTP
ncbi:MAG: serine/threonine protein kinase [Myxococcales bacterium]|nr:serine/threonine protein kinase [Myxococcales bacterium]